LHAVLFLKATLAGFLIAMPVGPIGALCLRRALQGRWMVGLVTGGGAALADAVLAAGAILGLTLITGYLTTYRVPLQLFGGLFLILLGGRMMLRARHATARLPSGVQTSVGGRHLGAWFGDFGIGFALTIVNPATLLAFVGVFAGLGILPEEDVTRLQALLVVAGVCCGSFLWWLTLTGGSAALRHHIPDGIVRIINIALGAVVATFGVAAMLGQFWPS
jgi:threonine/homoserine/homoserine lactone efflux protein